MKRPQFKARQKSNNFPSNSIFAVYNNSFIERGTRAEIFSELLDVFWMHGPDLTLKYDPYHWSLISIGSWLMIRQTQASVLSVLYQGGKINIGSVTGNFSLSIRGSRRGLQPMRSQCHSVPGVWCLCQDKWKSDKQITTNIFRNARIRLTIEH